MPRSPASAGPVQGPEISLDPSGFLDRCAATAFSSNRRHTRILRPQRRRQRTDLSVDATFLPVPECPPTQGGGRSHRSGELLRRRSHSTCRGWWGGRTTGLEPATPRNHNPVLYQLSYVRHDAPNAPSVFPNNRTGSVPVGTSQGPAPRRSAFNPGASPEGPAWQRAR